MEGAKVNKYNLRYLVWCIAAKYDAYIMQEPLGRRYEVNFGVSIESDNVALIAQDIKDSLKSRGFVEDGNQYLQGARSHVYFHYGDKNLSIAIWRRR